MLLRNTPELWKLRSDVDHAEMPDTDFDDRQIIALHHLIVVGELPAGWGMHWAWDRKKRKTLTQAYP
jgi:hypothetical protein